MAFPQSPGKHADAAFVTASKLLEHRAASGRPVGGVPRSVIVTWQRSMFQRVNGERGCPPIPTAGEIVTLTAEIALAFLPIGAPGAAIALETLAAGGVERVIGVGTAGALTDDVEPGDVVVCSKALRDEGTSYHYAPAAAWAYPDTVLTDALRGTLPDAAFGPSWTTDAPYRETADEIARYRAEGVLTVEMEASALFVVGAALGIRCAAAFSVSDVLHGAEWEPHFHSSRVDDGWMQALEAAETVLSR